MVRAPRYGYQDPFQRWQRSLIWQEPERIDDASDYYRRNLAGDDDEITLEDIEGPPVFDRRIDQRPLQPRDIPNDMLERNPFQQAGIKIETDAERAARRAAQQADWETYQRQQAGGPASAIPALTDPNVSPLAGGFSGGDPGPAPLIAGPSISDRVRGNRYTNMDPRDRQALLQTIGGEIDPRRTRYGTPEAEQEIANIVETVTNRAARSGKSIEDTVKERSQYSTWNKPAWRSRAQENLEQFGPDIRRAVSGAITGDIQPTNEGLTHYHSEDVRPNWASDNPAAKVGPHIFYNDVYSPDMGPQLPPSPAGEVTSQDIGPPPFSSLIAGRPDAPLGGMPAAPTPTQMVRPEGPLGALPAAPASPLAGLVADPLARPLSPTSQFDSSIDQTLAVGGGGSQLPSRPLIAPSPLTPEQVTAGQQRVNEMLDPALEAAKNVPPALAPDTRYDPLSAAAMGPSAPPGPRPPLIALAEDRATRERAPQGPPAGVPQTPLISPSPMPGVDIGQMPMSAGATPPAPVQSEIVPPPAGPLIDQTLAVGRPPLVAPAATVPSGAPLVTPRRTVTPQTPVSPEPESNLPPLPPTTVPDMPVAAAPETAGMGTSAPLIAPSADYAGPTARSRRTGFLGNLFDREHFVGGPGLTRPVGTVTDYTKSAKPERGRYKPAEHERLAGRIGKAAVGIPLAAIGVPLPVAMSVGGVAGRMTNRAFDPNRQVFERGPVRFFGGIFGRGRGTKKDDENKNNDPAGIKEAAAAHEAAAQVGASGGSGRGSDRGGFMGGGYGYGGGYYGGGSYPGYGGYGGGYGPDSTGGAYRNR